MKRFATTLSLSLACAGTLTAAADGHGFARAPNRLSFNAVTEAFLSKCLGGRYEPVGSAFNGSTVQVIEGAEHVPGLAAALPAASR